jgi:predicted permease
MRLSPFALRQATRILRRAPRFSALAVTILALGIGATTLMFTIVEAVLLRDLPFRDPDRLVWMYNLRTERDRAPISIPDFEDYRRESSTVAGLAAFTNWTANLTGDGAPERLEGTRVSGNFFELLGVEPARGRGLQPQDEQTDARVVVLTHSLWVRRFGSDERVLGRGISLNGSTYIVVGILPERFLFPFREAEIAVPLATRRDPRRDDRGANFLRVVARLAPGVAIAQANADLNGIARRLQKRYPVDDARKTGVSLYPLHREIVRDYRGVLWMLFGSVGVLLAVGCVNLANLLLVRAAGRRTELTVRQSLGASRARLMRMLLAESAMLAAIGGLAGIAVAVLGVAAWQRWGPNDFPQMTALGVSPYALIFAIAVSCLTAIACGIVPAWVASNEIATSLSSTSRVTSNRRQAILQRTFVAAQIAAATILLVGMTLMRQGLVRLEHVVPGFTPDHALSFQLSLPPAGYATPEALGAFFDRLKDRLETIPGVERVGAVSLLPLSGLLSAVDVVFPDRPAPPPDEVPQAHFRIATPAYFAAAGITIVDGRPFAEDDRRHGRSVAIVSRTFARRHWPGVRAVGQFVQLVQAAPSPPLEVVGVVSDVKQSTLDAAPTADLYVPLHQMPQSQAMLLASRMYWIVRGRADSALLDRAVREAVAQVDAGVAASPPRTLEAVWSASLAPRRINVRVLEFFGEVALGLSALGVYGVAAYSMRTRRRELAIRVALGAGRRALIQDALSGELVAILLGVSAGLIGALSTAPVFFATAFDTDPRDGTTYVTIGITMIVVALCACYIPVRRAAAGNPVEALRLSE